MFTTVSRALERRPERLLFFDDLPANVRAARELGWHASVYTDPPAAAAILAEAGLLERTRVDDERTDLAQPRRR
jgi:FMN phosphatase YigB (HAD superfamily)